MALPPLAPVSDLEKRLGLAVGSLSGEDRARAEASLEDVSALIRAEAGLDWVDADGVTITAPDPVVVVCRQAAKRAYLNPEDLTGENVGDIGSQRQVVGVYLTADEKTIIRTAADGGVKSRTFDVRTPTAYGDTANADPAWYFWGLE